MCRPGRKRSQQSEYEIDETGWRQAVEELVLEVDIERDARGHAFEGMNGSR